MNYLEEVTITAQRIKGIHPLSPGRQQDRKITLNELSTRTKNTATVYEYLRSVSDIVYKRESGGTFAGHIFGFAADDDGVRRPLLIRYVFVVDGYFWPGNDGATESILSIPLDRVEEIEIVRSPAPPIVLKEFGNRVVNDPLELEARFLTDSPEDVIPPAFSYLDLKLNRRESDASQKRNLRSGNFTLPDPPTGYLPTILITTKARDGGFQSEDKGKSLRITPLGYQVSKEFYSPAYETPEQQNEEKPDLRTTVYWNPDVRSNDEGDAEMLFYAADAETIYTVTVEGITDEGVLIRKTEKIKRAATHSPPKSF